MALPAPIGDVWDGGSQTRAGNSSRIRDPSVLAGLTKKSLDPGTEVAVRGYLSRSGEKVASGSSIIFKSGAKMSFASETTPVTDKNAMLEWISSDEEIWRIQIAELRRNNSQ